MLASNPIPDGSRSPLKEGIGNATLFLQQSGFISFAVYSSGKYSRGDRSSHRGLGRAVCKLSRGFERCRAWNDSATNGRLHSPEWNNSLRARHSNDAQSVARIVERIGARAVRLLTHAV